MKSLFLLLAAAAMASAQAPAGPKLKPGDDVKPDALASAKWLQGEAPKAWEPGKVYIIECWATWCGPCIASIPHVNELHKKYAEKGLRVMGMNVWDKGEDVVTRFVKGKGEGMSYPVAYAEKGGKFEQEWLVAADVHGIPHAFVVSNGKLLFSTHPARLSDEMVEKLLAGGDTAKTAIEDAAKAEGNQKAMSSAMMAFQKASSTQDTETMAAKIAELEKLGADKTMLDALRIDLLIAKDYDAAAKSIREAPEGPARTIAVMRATRIVMNTECPADFVKTIATLAAEDAKKATDGNPLRLVQLALLQWKAGEKEAAVATAKAAAEKPDKLPAEPFNRFAKAFADGNPPTMQEFIKWIQEAMSKDQPKPGTPQGATPNGAVPKGAVPMGRVTPHH